LRDCAVISDSLEKNLQSILFYSISENTNFQTASYMPTTVFFRTQSRKL